MKNELTLNEFTVKSLYQFPEETLNKTNLLLLIFSVEKINDNKDLNYKLELVDLRYKIKNIYLNCEYNLSKGNLIKINTLFYKFDEKMKIEIRDYEIIDNNNQYFFLEKYQEYKNEFYVNSYFLYTNNKFIGFNNENLIIPTNILSKFNNSFIYYFKRLKNENNLNLKYIKNISYFIQKSGKSNINLAKLNNKIPYNIEGKILQIEKNQILLKVSNINKIISLIYDNKKFKDIYENQYISISSIRYHMEDYENNIIYFKVTDFSRINIQKNNIEEFDDQRIFLKFNLFGNLNDSKISYIQIETQKNIYHNIKLNQQKIYYLYSHYNSEIDYFPQKINLVYIDNFSRTFKILVYKGFLNEINVYVDEIGSCSYEYLYYSSNQNYFSQFVEINLNGIVKKFMNFQNFGTKTRQKITFINIPVQNKEDIGNGNNYLKIYFCSKNEIKFYGTLKINSIKFKNLKEYIINSTIDDFLKNIYNEIHDVLYSNSKKHDELINKYINIDKNLSSIIENEIYKEFDSYIIKDEEHTLKYFNSLVIWNIFNYIIKNNGIYSCIKEYIEIYEIIIKKNNLNYIDKSMLLIGIALRIKENEKTFICPKIFFYEDLNDNNPYKIAYKFQFEIIDNITEYSRLFHPFLLLDSYFMDMINYKDSNIIENENNNAIISAYTISMLPIEIVKKHLTKTIKPYFLLFQKNYLNETQYYASVQKDNNVITYNENILLEETFYKSIEECDKISLIKDYAFILNFENIHENFSHNKERILNKTNSPTLFFNHDFEYSFAFENYNEKNLKGEAGILLESFICDEKTIEEIKKIKYKMGEYLKIKYFIQKDFSELLKGFEDKKEEYKKNSFLNNNIQKDDILTNYRKFDDVKFKKNEIKNENNIEINKGKKNEMNSFDNKNEDVIFLSRYNTVVIKADNLTELFKKIESMKKKKFIRPKIIVPRNNKKTNY